MTTGVQPTHGDASAEDAAELLIVEYANSFGLRTVIDRCLDQVPWGALIDGDDVNAGKGRDC